MARPPSKKVNLKKGYYIEVKSGPNAHGIKIRRETLDTIRQAFNQYQSGYIVTYLGRWEDGEWHDVTDKP